MKKTLFIRMISLILIFAMLVGTVPVTAATTQTTTGHTAYDTKFSNGYIEYLVDKNDGRFIIRTEDGSPNRDTDSDKKLLFDKNNDPETSFTSFKINGEEYIFGNDYGFLNNKGKFIQRPTNVGSVNSSIWEIDDVIITQKIELVEDADNPNVGNVKMRYEIKNNSNETKKIGSRILLDTMLGENDGAAVVLGNTNETITNESEIIGENIPTYWRCSDDIFAPKVVSYGFTKGWGNPAPNKMIVAHWSNLSETKWDYNIDANLNFTENSNDLGTSDSAVALYWNEENLKSGEVKVVETYYGLGDLSNYESNSPYNAKLYSPEKLTVNSSKDGYNEGTIEVILEIDNTLSESENLTNVKAKLLTKTDGFTFLQGEEQEKTIPIINKGEIASVTWNISTVNQDIYTSEPIKVEITSDNNVEPVTDISYILMPSIQGNPPEIQILSTSPEKIYYEGDKYISIKGNGFNYFNNKNLWKMYLVHESGKRYEIPRDSIEVLDNTVINISILDGQIDEDMLVGKYSISIEHTDFKEPINIPNDKRVEFTSDINYKSRTYGILFVEKRKKDNEYYYYLNTIDSKEKLDELKSYIRENAKAPSNYENSAETLSKGVLVDIIFDIVGDVKMTIDQTTGLEVYKINTDQKSAIINSVIKYKDANKPIEIKKVDDLILIKGNGTLQLVNYGEIWWNGFESFISDKQNYVIDEIIEEDEDDDDEDDDEETDEYLVDADELEIEPNLDEEEKVNLEISLFDPLSIIAASASLFLDGFELELKDIILLDEGASLGGKLAVEIPIGKKEDTTTDTQNDNTAVDTGDANDGKLTEDEAENEIGDAMHTMFMTEDERREEDIETYKKAVETENSQQLARIDKEKKEKILKNSKLRAAIINDDKIGEEIIKLFQDDVPTSTKVETAIKLIPQSKNLIVKVLNIINNKDDDDDDDDKSVGIEIDVKKVVFGKKYGEDYIYNDVKFIGVDGSGKVNIELPGFNVGGKQKEQGISAELTVNTMEGIYSIDADVNIKVAEAHAFITVMRFKDKENLDSDYKYVLDDLVLSGGYVPGIPIAPPLFISEVGGGVEDLYGVITDNKDSPPMKVVIILGLNVVPAFQGDFELKVSKNGFSLDGALSIKKFEILKQARAELQWAKPIYFALAAKIEAFDVIEGEVSIYIGQVETGNKSDPYEFYFEGRAKAEISVPKKVPLAGGIKLAGVDLGVSTKKLWGKFKVGFVPIGITWIYDEGVKFGQAMDGYPQYQYVSLTDVQVPYTYWHSYECQDENEEMKMVIGSNISVLGTSKYEYASLGDIQANPYIMASVDRKIHEFDFQGVEIGVIELSFKDKVPNLTLKNPQGNIYPLISIDEDSENGNYRVQIIPADESESGNEERLVYIAIENPIDGIWTLESDEEVESTLLDVTVPPGFNSINMQQLNSDKLKITWDAHHAENSLVSLFILKQDEPDSAGYPLTSNLDGTSGKEGIEVNIPTGIAEGKYIVRGTIQHTQYGYESILSDNYITIIDYDKPADVSELNAQLYGNGLIKASWEPIDEEGDITYFATVYDKSGNAVRGFEDFEVSENSITLGGEYTNKITGEINSLQTEKEYKIGITTKKILNHDDSTQTIHIGEEVLSNTILLREPEVPKISIIYEDNSTVYNSKYYFNSNVVEMKFETDQSNVSTKVYLDGEYFTDFENSSYNLYFEFEDGKHKVNFISENQYKDYSEKTVVFNVDTTAPELLVDSPLPGYVSNTGQVQIKGTAENGSILKINGTEVILNSNDTFNYQYTIPANKLKDKIEIVASDIVGNTTKYSTEVTNGKIDYFKDIYIRPSIDEIISRNSYNLSVVGVDSKSNEIEIDPSNVKWSLIEGDAIADISEDGILTANEAGDIVLKASYYISDKYSYDDAVEIKILDNIDFIYLWPYVSSVQIGNSVNFGLYESTKYDESFVDNAIVDWEITNGNQYAIIDEYGHFTALKEGKVTLYGKYTDKFGNIQEITSEINITKESARNNFDIDGSISKIWINLIQREKNIVIENIVDISGGSSKSFSVRGIVEIEVPFNTVSGKDQMFVGTVNDPNSLVDISKYNILSDIIELQLKEAEGKLNNPIKVTFKYRGNNNINPENLGIYYYNTKFEKWQYIGGKVDTENGTIEVELNHLSKYVVFEKKDNSTFVDTKNRWSSKYIDSISSLDVVNGEVVGGQRYFNPSRQLTRLEFSAIVIRTFEKMYDEISPKMTFDEKTTFKDYGSSPDWGKEYIKKAYEYGLIKGIEEDGQLYFMPKKNITRAEVITVLGRILESYTKYNIPENTFTDKAIIPSWATEYVDLLQYADLLSGYNDGTIRTSNYITREEIAKICYEWIDYRDMELKKK